MFEFSTFNVFHFLLTDRPANEFFVSVNLKKKMMPQVIWLAAWFKFLITVQTVAKYSCNGVGEFLGRDEIDSNLNSIGQRHQKLDKHTVKWVLTMHWRTFF